MANKHQSNNHRLLGQISDKFTLRMDPCISYEIRGKHFSDFYTIIVLKQGSISNSGKPETSFDHINLTAQSGNKKNEK